MDSTYTINQNEGYINMTATELLCAIYAVASNNSSMPVDADKTCISGYGSIILARSNASNEDSFESRKLMMNTLIDMWMKNNRRSTPSGSPEQSLILQVYQSMQSVNDIDSMAKLGRNAGMMAKIMYR